MTRKHSAHPVAASKEEADAAGSDAPHGNDDISASPAVPTTREDRIRLAAYALSERRDFASGFETEDWLEAERQIDLDDDAITAPVETF